MDAKKCHFIAICNSFGEPALDLFASKNTNQCSRFYSYSPDRNSEGVDAFTFKWSESLLYAFPPFCLISRVLKKICNDKCRCIVVVPLWKSQVWYPEFERLRQSNSLIFGPEKDLLTSPFSNRHHPLHSSLKLVAAILQDVHS